MSFLQCQRRSNILNLSCRNLFAFPKCGNRVCAGVMAQRTGLPAEECNTHTHTLSFLSWFLFTLTIPLDCLHCRTEKDVVPTSFKWPAGMWCVVCFRVSFTGFTVVLRIPKACNRSRGLQWWWPHYAASAVPRGGLDHRWCHRCVLNIDKISSISMPEG